MKKAPAAAVRRILHAVIALEVAKGHRKWSVAELARKVGVSRPLIYYHFGKTKPKILETSILLVAEEFFGLTEERVRLLTEGRAVESLLASRRLFLNNPSFALFYLRWRMTKSPIQKKLLEIETRYQTMLSELFPRAGAAEVRALHGLFYAVVTAPFLDDAAIERLIAAADRLGRPRA